jgi:hypothetical protein
VNDEEIRIGEFSFFGFHPFSCGDPVQDDLLEYVNE